MKVDLYYKTKEEFVIGDDGEFIANQINNICEIHHFRNGGMLRQEKVLNYLSLDDIIVVAIDNGVVVGYLLASFTNNHPNVNYWEKHCGNFWNVEDERNILKEKSCERFWNLRDMDDITWGGIIKSNAVYLEQIALKPQYRGMGVAKSMVEAIKSNNPENLIIANVSVRNSYSMSFFSKLGFHPTGSFITENYGGEDNYCSLLLTNKKSKNCRIFRNLNISFQ